MGSEFGIIGTSLNLSNIMPKNFDWYAFRNETAAKILAARCSNANWQIDESSIHGISQAVNMADELVYYLMHKEEKINRLTEEYNTQKKNKKATGI